MSEKQHILIVDDDPQFVESVTTLLESVGYRTSHTYRVERAMELAKKEKPDLILLDVMFIDQPGPDGITFSIQLHENPDVKDIPVIILSGIKQVVDFPYEYRPDPTYMPVVAFLDKPIKPDELLVKIEQVISSGPRWLRRPHPRQAACRD